MPSIKQRLEDLVDATKAQLTALSSGKVSHRTLAQVRAMTTVPTAPVRVPGRAGGFFEVVAGDTTTPDDGVLTLVTANGIRLKRNYEGAKNGLWWGLVGDGVANDTQAMTNVLNAFFASSKEEDFLIPNGIYKITSPIVITTTAYSGVKKYLTFRGVLDFSTMTSGIGLTFKQGTAMLTAGLVIDGLRCIGGANQVMLDGGDIGSNQYFYRSRYINWKLTNFTGNGLTIKGNVFESDFQFLNAECANITTGKCIFLDGTSTGGSLISSLTFRSVETSGGLYGIHQIGTITDVLWEGLTILSAGREGQLMEGTQNQVFIRCHYEDNWKGATSKATGGAGLRLIGDGVIVGVNGYSGTGFQKNLATGYASGGNITVVGGQFGGGANVEEVFLAEGNGPGAGFCIFGTSYRVPDYTNIRYSAMSGGLLRTTHNSPAFLGFVAASPSMTFSLDNSSYFTIDGLDASGNITIQNLVGRAPSEGETVRFAIRQASGGLKSITWASGWKGAIPAFSAGYAQGQLYEFTFIFGNWYYTGT